MANGAAVVIPDHHSQRQQDVWTVITALVLDGIASPHTRRAYSQALEEFLIWFRDVPGREFNKAAVQKYRSELQSKGLAASSINVRLSAIRRLALEAADNQIMSPDIAAGIGRAKGARRAGVRLGQWLTAAQAESLLSLPHLSTAKGIRDYAILALLLTAGLRRSELAMLSWQQMQQREGRWLIVDLNGKHGRIRSVPIPLWVYTAVAQWGSFVGIGDGLVFRAVSRHGSVLPHGISPQSVFDIVKTYARKLGFAILRHPAPFFQVIVKKAVEIAASPTPWKYKFWSLPFAVKC